MTSWLAGRGSWKHAVRQTVAATAMGVFSLAVYAQESSANGPEIQREAMHKLGFLAGQWSGPVSIQRGPGEPLRLTQTENVEYKLDGLVLLIQGKSVGTDGKARFEALATVAYDDGIHSYRIRAYNGGTISTPSCQWLPMGSPGDFRRVRRIL